MYLRLREPAPEHLVPLTTRDAVTARASVGACPGAFSRPKRQSRVSALVSQIPRPLRGGGPRCKSAASFAVGSEGPAASAASKGLGDDSIVLDRVKWWRVLRDLALQFLRNGNEFLILRGPRAIHIISQTDPWRLALEFDLEFALQ